MNKQFLRPWLILGVTIFSLIILECMARIVSPAKPYHVLLPFFADSRREVHINLGGLSRVAIQSTNGWGLRGDEPPLSEWKKYLTIVTIGGSTTQCFFIDDHKTWPYLLQEELKRRYPKVWVGNGGLLGHTTRAHIIFMKEIIPQIKPDIVILLVGANDLGFSLSENRQDCGSRFDDYKSSWKRSLISKSRLIQILSIWKLRLFKDAYIEKRQGPEKFIPQPLKGAPTPLPDDLKIALPCLSQYRKNIEEIINLGKSMKVRVIFLTQPSLFDDTPYWRNMEGGFYWIKKPAAKFSAATHWRLLDIYNQELIEVCKTKDIEYLDLASLIPHSDLYFYDSVHFTEKGAELVAQKIFEFLKIER